MTDEGVNHMHVSCHYSVRDALRDFECLGWRVRSANAHPQMVSFMTHEHCGLADTMRQPRLLLALSLIGGGGRGVKADYSYTDERDEARLGVGGPQCSLSFVLRSEHCAKHLHRLLDALYGLTEQQVLEL